MIKFEKTETYGWEAAIRGMRNPLNSWGKSDSFKYEPHITDDGMSDIGPVDLDLMQRLRKAGTDHRKYLRMIGVSVDITAPFYWWKEADTYKVGTVANSCSTMHKVMAKPFELDDFSHDHLSEFSLKQLQDLIIYLNSLRNTYLVLQKGEQAQGAKEAWWQVIQLLPSSYNQKRTITLNYEVLNNMYHSRKNHKLDEWSIGFCEWVESLPYAAELITSDLK